MLDVMALLHTGPPVNLTIRQEPLKTLRFLVQKKFFLGSPSSALSEVDLDVGEGLLSFIFHP